LLIKRGDVKVHRRAGNGPWRDDYRFRVDHWRRGIAANIDLAINTGLVDANGHPHLRVDGGYDASSQGERNQFFHRVSPEVNSSCNVETCTCDDRTGVSAHTVTGIYTGERIVLRAGFEAGGPGPEFPLPGAAPAYAVI
jgi:hypothetical protein